MIRSELKARGKAAFKANYWKSVLVAILLTIAVGGWNAGSSSNSVDFQELTARSRHSPIPSIPKTMPPSRVKILTRPTSIRTSASCLVTTRPPRPSPHPCPSA